MILKQIAELDRAKFTAAVGWVFEQSPWVAERTWDYRPFPVLESLHATMVAQVNRASKMEQLALIRAHPDLGARAKMTEASVGEQAGVGLDSLSPDEYKRLTDLNNAYRAKFGFPFIYAVKGSTKHDIMNALEQRLKDDPEKEFHEALGQIYRIARFRLMDSIKG